MRDDCVGGVMKAGGYSVRGCICLELHRSRGTKRPAACNISAGYTDMGLIVSTLYFSIFTFFVYILCASAAKLLTLL